LINASDLGRFARKNLGEGIAALDNVYNIVYGLPKGTGTVT